MVYCCVCCHSCWYFGVLFFEISVLIQQTIAAIMAKNRLLCMVHVGVGHVFLCMIVVIFAIVILIMVF